MAHPTDRPRSAWPGRALTLAVAVGLAVAGCNYLGVMAEVLSPPVTVEATYQPPEGKKWLVFVDDLRYPVSYEPVKRELTERLNKKLLEHEVARDTVAYDQLLDLISVTPDFNRLAVHEVGQKVNADIVLHVEITKFSTKDQEFSPLWRGHLETQIRLIDANNPDKHRLWPDGISLTEGYPMPPVTRPETTDSSNTYGERLTREMTEEMAEKISKLFYSYKMHPGDREREEAFNRQP